MLGLPSTTDLALLGVLCAAIAGGMLYERHEGAASVKTHDATAELKQAALDHQNDQDIISELRAKLAAMPAATAPPVLRLCPTPHSLRAQPAPAGAQPILATPAGEGSGGVPAGALGLDIGPDMQNVRRAAQTIAVYRDTTWDWSVRQSR